MIQDETYLEAFLRESVRAVDGELERLLPSSDTEPTRLHRAIRHSVFAGGKRFRPALTFAVGKSFGASLAQLVTVASAIEMIHTYSLIHDDLPSMDDDDLRRGVTTCHKEFGESTAILAGDALQALAFHAIANSEKLTPEVKVAIIVELTNAAGSPNGMVAGQQLDLDGEGKRLSSDQLEEIHRRKTGRMIVAAARSGAIIGGADESALEAVGQYGELLGLLFQITDDLLDVTQPTSVLGKTAGKDVTLEKATYPALFGIEKSREMAADVHRKAILELNKLPEPTLLREIADFVLSRNT